MISTILQPYSSLIPGPLFLRTHGEATPDARVCTALGRSLELSLGLLGAGGEASPGRAGFPPPSHEDLSCASVWWSTHDGLKLWPLPPRSSAGLLCAARSIKWEILADATPISKSTRWLAQGSLPRLGHPVRAGFRPLGSQTLSLSRD